MKIINSKYSAKELNEIYERETAKVDKKACKTTFCSFSSKAAKKLFLKHCENVNKILESPLGNYWLNIRFIEYGEKLQELLSFGTGRKLLLKKDSCGDNEYLTVLQENPETGILTEMERFLIGPLVKDEDWDKFMSPDGTLDFSIYDEKLEECLRKVQD